MGLMKRDIESLLVELGTQLNLWHAFDVSVRTCVTS